MVRETLGDDAVIVATREERGGAAVRVTAAVEPAFELNRRGAAEADDWLQYDNEDEEFAVAEELTEAMLRHNVPEDVMDNIVSCATVIGMENPGIALIAALEHLFHYRPLPQGAHKRPMMFMGPPGSGKTLAVAKLAARGTMNGMKVGVITCDTIRAGGVEQLQAFTKLLGIDLLKAGSPADLKHMISDLRGHDQILIDSPGTNPFNMDDVKALAKLVGTGDIEPHLVLGAGMDTEESSETARAFATVGAHTIIPMRIDIARRLGGILAAVHSGSLAFADASNTAKVADGFFSLTPKSLAKLLMPSGFPAQGSGQTNGALKRTGTQ